MLAKYIFLSFLFYFVILVVQICDSASVKTNHRNNNNDNKRILPDGKTANRTGRGFFFRGSLLSFSKVLNFFPVGGERECTPEGYNVARAGICVNAYDCRQRDGRAAGDCAHGLGVCCVFEVTCGGTVQNNLTYFMSPGFPDLWSGDRDCDITIDKAHEGITQLRIDFVHFNIGQPNRTTGECDEDAMVLGDGDSKFSLCGQNHGQHMYYSLSTKSVAKESDELAGTASTKLSLKLRGGESSRLWLIRLAQMPLAHAAPHECLQYYTQDNGTIKTFNYATNGRHLAGQDYKVCIRRNSKRCSVRYTPCDQRSFRIGTGAQSAYAMDPSALESGPGSQGGPGTGFYGPDGSFHPGVTVNQATEAVVLDHIQETINVTEEMMIVDPSQAQEDEIEGSGDEMPMEPQIEEPSMMSRMWSYITSWIWGQSSARYLRWSPYAQHYREDDKFSDDEFRYQGYGNYGDGLNGYGRQRCQDRVTIPCENEYFVSGEYYGVGVCDPHHCGNTFCPGQNFQDCRIESSITPFAVSIHFGPPTFKRSPEENIGMCLRYNQMPCDG